MSLVWQGMDLWLDFDELVLSAGLSFDCALECTILAIHCRTAKCMDSPFGDTLSHRVIHVLLRLKLLCSKLYSLLADAPIGWPYLQRDLSRTTGKIQGQGLRQCLQLCLKQQETMRVLLETPIPPSNQRPAKVGVATMSMLLGQ